MTTEYVHMDDVHQILAELKETELEFYKTQSLYWKGLYELTLSSKIVAETERAYCEQCIAQFEKAWEQLRSSGTQLTPAMSLALELAENVNNV